MTTLNLDNIDLGGFGATDVKPVEEGTGFVGEQYSLDSHTSSTMSEALKTDADQYSKTKQLSRDSGMPESAVVSDPAAVETNLKLQNIDFADMSRRTPNTSQFLTDFDNAVIAQDDIDAMQTVEDVLRSIPAGLVSGIGMGIEGTGRFVEAGGRLTGRALLNILPESFEPFILETEKTPELVKDFNDLVDVASLFRRAGAGIKISGEDIGDVPPERQNIATDIAGGLGQVGGQIAATIVNPSLAMGMMFGQGVDQQGERQQASGTEGRDSISDLALIAGGGVTALTERMGIDALMNRIPPKIKNNIARQIADVSIAGGVEAVQEVVEGIAQGFIEQLTTNPDAEIFEGLDREAIAAGGVGAIVRAMVNTLTPGKVRSAKEADDQNITQGQIEQNALDTLNVQIGNMKMQQRDAETLRAFVEKVDDQDTHIFIDSLQASLFLQDKTPEQIAEDPSLQLVKNGVEESSVTGTDVAIPLTDFATDMAGSKTFDELRDHITMSPEAVTPFRAEAAREETNNYVQELMAEAEQNVSQYVESQEIFDTVRQQLVDTGQVTPQNASVMAQVVPAWATVYAKTNGISVQEAYTRSGLTIEGPQTGERARLEGELEILKQEVPTGDDLALTEGGNKTYIDGVTTVKPLELGAPIKSNKGVEDHKTNILKTGKVMPIEMDHEGFIVDGEHRYSAMVELGVEDIPVFVGTQLGAAGRLEEPYSGISQTVIVPDTLLEQAPVTDITDQIESEAFKEWSDNGEVIESEDINDHEFKADTPVVVKVFHGTTHKFSVFDALRGNLEGQFGAVNYFTSSEKDATDNYAGEGPDLTNRIEIRTDQLADIVYDDPESFGTTEADLDERGDEVLFEIARRELTGGQDQTMELFVKLDNPFVIGENAEWIEFIDDGDVQEQAVQQVADEEGIDVDEVRDNPEDYEDQIDEARWAIQEETEHPLISAVQTVSERHDVDASELAAEIYDLGETARPEDVEQLLRSSDDYAFAEDPETGGLIGSQLISEVIQELGFDSIILKNAEGRFTNMGMEPDTTHVHIFDSGKANIKSVENQGTFDPTDPDIFKQPVQVKTANEVQTELMSEFDGVKISLSGSGKRATVNKIIIPEDQRNTGVGTDIMNRIASWADSNGIQLALTPSADFGGTKSRLNKFYKRFGFVDNKGKNKDFEVSETMVREPEAPLAQTDEGDKGTRGYYDPANSLIRLTESADLSTFLHEFAHFMYEMELNTDSDTSTSINNWFKRNASAVALEAGTYEPNTTIIPRHVVQFLDEGTTGDAKRDMGVRRAVHEQFARGFETYLMEGKAPSVELRNAFRTFARWMTQIYRAVRGQLNVNLDAEMRQVFDRMLATDEQIAAANARDKHAPMFTDAAVAGMTEEQFQSYNDQVEKVKDVETETLRDKLIKEITRSTKKQWNDEKSDIIDEQLEILKDEKVYRATEQLRNGDIKLDHATVKEMVGFERTDKRGRKSTRIPESLRGMTAKGQEGIHPDAAAAMLGYSSGSEMITDLMNATPINKLAEQNAETIMLERHGDIMNDGTIEKEADEAVHNEERGKLILQELKALRRGTNIPALERAQIKAFAEESIGRLTYRTIFPSKYRKAEVAAAQDAATALANGDKEAAANAKARQVLNYYLGNAATDARNETDKIVDRMARYNKRKVREEIQKADGGYWEQIVKILNRFEFRKTATLKSVDEQNVPITEWMNERIDVEGDALVITNAVLNETYQTHWKNVPFEVLTGVNDSVKNIEHVARYGNKIRGMGELVDFKKYVNQWTDHMNAVQDDRFKSQRTDVVEGRNWGRWAMAQMTKIPYLASWLDGGERVGMSHDTLVQPFTDAYNEEVNLWADAGKPVMDLIEGRDKATIKRHNTKIFIPEIKDPLNDGNLFGHQILAVALNTGNAENLRKMLLGEGWADPEVETDISFSNPQLQAVLKHMTKDDWELVQNIWDRMDTLYPALAEVHRKTTGLVPPKVEAQVVPTEFGNFKGGYYPIKYDPNRSNRAAENEERLNASTDSMFSGSLSIQASVSASATNERTGYYGPIRLSLDVVPNHFQETIHFITHHDAVRQTNKLIRDNKVTNVIKAKLGPEEYAQLKPWLNDIAKDGREAPTKMFWDKALQQLRFGVTLGAMGFKASTGIIQISGLSNTIAELGLKPVMQSMRSILASENTIKSAWEFAEANSKVMAHRVNTMDREIKNAMSKIEGKRGLLAAAQETSMKHIALIQTYMVDLPSWHAAYIKSMEEHGDEARAYKHADWVIENIQGSGVTKDMAQIMRGQSETGRMFTMFMTFFSALWNLERDLVKGAKSGRYSVTTVAAKAAFLFTLPVLFEMLMRGELGAEDDEPEEQLQKMLTKVAMFPVQSVPFVRDIANAVGGDFGYNMSPLSSILEQGTQAIPKLVQNSFTDEEITASQAKGTVKFIGAAAGIPGIGQAFATGEHIYEVIEDGEEFTMHQLLFGPKRD